MDANEGKDAAELRPAETRRDDAGDTDEDERVHSADVVKAPVAIERKLPWRKTGFRWAAIRLRRAFIRSAT